MRSLKLLFLSGIPLAGLLAISASLSAEPRIGSIEIENSTRIPTEEILKVIPIREGDPFNPARVEQAVSYLKKWGPFRSVEAEKEMTRGGVALRFLLRGGYLVSGIDIYGNYPFLSARLRRTITVHSGDLYDPDAAKEQEKKLEAFYERKGFEGTEVLLNPRINEKKGTVDLVYRIRKGIRYRIGPITVLGNTIFPQGYFVSRLNPLRVYEPVRFRESLQKIREDYQKKGFLNARVRLKDLGKDPLTKKTHPVLEITEGRRVHVVFEGNKRVSRRTFKKILPMFTGGGTQSLDIEASVQTIADTYRRRGFQEVNVTSEQKELKGGGLGLRFVISEGPETRVKKIRIEGNQMISDRKIKRGLTTREETPVERGSYQPKTIEQDFKDLPRLLKNRGALEGEALHHETTFNRWRDKAVVTFGVREGEITRVSLIRFAGNDHLPAARLKKRLKLGPGNPFSPELMEQDKEQLTLTYANNGFPYAEVQGELVREGNQAVLSYRINEGTPVRIGEILVVGNERTGKNSIERSLLLRKGQPFSYQKVLESERVLRRTGSFRSARIETIGLTEKEPVVHLLVRLEEYRKILLDLGATYDTDNSFTGNLTVSDVNLFGTTRRGNFKLIGGRDIQKGEVILKDSNFLGLPFEAAVSGHLERQRRPGFETREGGGALSLLREFTSTTTFLGRYEVARTFFTDVTDATGTAEEDHTTSKFSFSLNYDKRDSFSDPHRGFVAFAGLDLSNKLFASTFNFIQPKGFFAHYLNLGGRMTLLNYFRMEGIKVFGGDTLTRDERLFLGGDYSVRGFDEDRVGPIGADNRPAGGQVLLAQTTELQTRLFKGIELALFIDHGSITNNFSKIGNSSFRDSAGFGLRYVTPVGPLRLDYGIKLDRKTGEDFGRLHFAFGYAF